MKKLVLFLSLSTLFSLSACNTVQGLGQDIQQTGEKIEDATVRQPSINQ